MRGLSEGGCTLYRGFRFRGANKGTEGTQSVSGDSFRKQIIRSIKKRF